MKKVQKGTVLYCYKDGTTDIYNAFSDYFDIVELEPGFNLKYVVSKEPSEELIRAIENHYAAEKERNRKHDEFVDSVAQKVYEELSDEQRQVIFENPDSSYHHHFLGAYIRGNYFNKEDIDFELLDSDGLSSEIVRKIASLIIDDYDFDNLFYRCLYDDIVFVNLRMIYHVMTGEYPTDITDKYSELPDGEEAAKAARNELMSIVVNEDRFRELAHKYQMTDKQFEECKTIIDEYNAKNWDKVPYDFVLLAGKDIPQEERNKLLKLMEASLHRARRLIDKLPAYVFSGKDTVMTAVSLSGISLERFASYNEDDEVIRAALESDGEAIQFVNEGCRDNPEYIRLALSSKYSHALGLDCMEKYRDCDDLVKIALETDGSNIKWASPRLKDDFDMAAFAIRHRIWKSIFDELSERLRDNTELALIDINEGGAEVDAYSDRLRDSEEIAQALLASEQHSWRIHYMSDRIRDKYDEE